MRKGLLILLMGVAVQIQAQQCIWQRTDSVAVVGLLRQAVGQHQTNLPLFFACELKGKPYVAHTLEGQPTERLVVNLRQFDCTTLVENVAALTLCARRGQTSFADFCTTLTSLRYRNHKIDGYTSRLHYFTDWIVSNANAGWVKEIQDNKVPFTAIQRIHVNYMSKNPHRYKALQSHPEDVGVIAEQERSLTGRTFRYIPSGQTACEKDLRRVVKDGDILAFVTDKEGLDITHVGLAMWQADGLHLLHASSVRKKVVLESVTLSRYLEKHPSFLGFRVVRIE